MPKRKRRTMKAQIALRLPKDLLADLEAVARRENPDEDLPISVFIRRAIREFVDRAKKRRK